jgi:hypothetical protein
MTNIYEKVRASSKVLLPINNETDSVMQEFSVLPPFLYSLYGGAQNKRNFQDVQTYCMFIGYPRSGHSLLGALIDAHPNAIIAHEQDTLQFIENSLPFGRNQLYSLLLQNSARFAAEGRTWCGYSYAVPNQWQGKYKKLLVVGDKKGGISTIKIGKDPTLVDRLEATIKVPIKFLHVVRNPFDNISTIAIKEPRPLENAIDYYFSSVATNAKLREKMDVHDVELEELIDKPERTIKTICQFLDIEPGKKYLADCSGIVRTRPRQTRKQLQWDKASIARVSKEIQKYDFLKSYSYD